MMREKEREGREDMGGYTNRRNRGKVWYSDEDRENMVILLQ